MASPNYVALTTQVAHNTRKQQPLTTGKSLIENKLVLKINNYMKTRTFYSKLTYSLIRESKQIPLKDLMAIKYF